jgi:hypothetical protein
MHRRWGPGGFKGVSDVAVAEASAPHATIDDFAEKGALMGEIALTDNSSDKHQHQQQQPLPINKGL